MTRGVLGFAGVFRVRPVGVVVVGRVVEDDEGVANGSSSERIREMVGVARGVGSAVTETLLLSPRISKVYDEGVKYPESARDGARGFGLGKVGLRGMGLRALRGS